MKNKDFRDMIDELAEFEDKIVDVIHDLEGAMQWDSYTFEHGNEGLAYARAEAIKEAAAKLRKALDL